MHLRIWLVTGLALLMLLGMRPAAKASGPFSVLAGDVQALEGEWLYVEDRTAGRTDEDRQPPMSMTFTLRVEEDAVVMVRGAGEKRREMRLALDGSTTEVEGETSISRYRSAWKDGALEFETELVRVSDGTRIVLFRTELRPTDDGLLVRVEDGIALYRHPMDIPLPEPAAGTISDMAWLAGAWTGTKRRSSLEERWSPPLGGAMLGVSRTVLRDSMIGFEYLRIVERDDSLVYIAQPGGAPPTEFVLTEMGETRAVFENPRHDFPQRIVYELSAEGGLNASIGFATGGRPEVFEFTPEDR